MNLESALIITLGASQVFLVLAFALETSLDDALYLFRSPPKLIRANFAMNVAMPFIAVSIALLPIYPAIKLALLALSISPVPPFLPNRRPQLDGDDPYTLGLLSASTISSIIVIPLMVWVVSWLPGIKFNLPPEDMVAVAISTVLAPLVVGIALCAISPAIAKVFSYAVGLIAAVLLLGGQFVLLLAVWPAFVTIIGNGSFLVFIAFAAAGIVIGHLLGGPKTEDRAILALATGARHPGIAMLIMGSSGADEAISGAGIVTYFAASTFASALYTAWIKFGEGRRRGHISA